MNSAQRDEIWPPKIEELVGLLNGHERFFLASNKQRKYIYYLQKPTMQWSAPAERLASETANKQQQQQQQLAF